MFDINVDVKVRLTSGASIELTEDQKVKIKNSALDIIFGDTSKVVSKTSKVVKKYHHWTPEQEKEMQVYMFNYPTIKERQSREARKVVREFCLKHRISRASFYSKLNHLKSKLPTRLIGDGVLTVSHQGGQSSYHGYTRSVGL